VFRPALLDAGVTDDELRRLRRVHVTVDRESGGRRTDLLHVHAAALHPDDVVEVGGLLRTSVARVVVDLARTPPFEQALVLADAARHRHLVTAADPRAESPGGTRSRVAIARAGLPAPTLQHEVPGIRARTDFSWPEFCTVGEFDGKVKYGRGLRPGQTPGDVVYAEKRPEDALRDLGFQVVRWTWDELSPFDAVAERLRRAFDRA
jgi:hypothetical protein